MCIKKQPLPTLELFGHFFSNFPSTPNRVVYKKNTPRTTLFVKAVVFGETVLKKPRDSCEGLNIISFQDYFILSVR